jgi:hypothetical protein
MERRSPRRVVPEVAVRGDEDAEISRKPTT